MNRRSFINGCIAALVMVQVPASAVKALCGTPETQYYCTKKLTELWLKAVKGSDKRFGTVNFECGREFFEGYEGELQCLQRFVPGDDPDPKTPKLLFKSGTLKAVGNGWDVRVVN